MLLSQLLLAAARVDGNYGDVAAAAAVVASADHDDAAVGVAAAVASAVAVKVALIGRTLRDRLVYTV